MFLNCKSKMAIKFSEKCFYFKIIFITRLFFAMLKALFFRPCLGQLRQRWGRVVGEGSVAAEDAGKK